MTTIINQVGQEIKIKPQGNLVADIFVGHKFCQALKVGKVLGEDWVGSKFFYTTSIPFFKDSEFNPVLLKDGSIIPYYKYNGQPIK